MNIPNTRLWKYSLPAALALLIPFNLMASLGMDIYLPAVPAMPVILGTSASVVQLTLSLYMIMLGVGQVLFGPLSDRIGRRPVLAIGIALFAASSAGLAITRDAAPFLTLRGLQALGASATLVAIFATIRDVYAGKAESNSIYGLMNAMLSFVPALGPIAGALILQMLGWPWIFGLLAGATVLLGIAILPLWPETRVPQPAGPGPGVAQIMTSGAFWAYTIAFGTAMGAFFVFFSTAPRVLINRAQMSELGFSLAFALVAAVMIAMARFAAHFADRWGVAGCALRGLAVMAVGAALLLAGHSGMTPSVVSFILPMRVVAAGIVMVGAVTANGALAQFGQIAGMAVALHFCLQSLIVGLLGTLFVTRLPGDTALPLAAFILFMTSLSAIAIMRDRQGRKGPRHAN